MKKYTFRLLRVAGLIASSVATSLCYADTTITIDADQPGPVINKNIYGQFMEHLGRGIYEGIWVGEDSAIPNINGYRSDVVKALQELKVPLLRWPGGCFADEYHWQDGIGPRDQRKITINTNWGGVTDDNAFGTHEFLDFAELIGADVYVNGNLGTGSAMEMAQWLEYMTAEVGGTLANLRKQNGREKPWNIDFFAVGNESWGCGGNMSPQYYSDLYRHFVSFLKAPKDNMPKLIASGGHDTLTEWTEQLIQQAEDVPMSGIAHHYYTLPSGDWDVAKGPALGFGEDQWFSTFLQTQRIEGFIQDNVRIMDQYDPEKKVGFYVDEWGTWYDPAEGSNPGFLYQQNSLRDALVAALNFNIFHKYADRIHMANIAQMVNVLQAMILTDKEKMVLTPTYHAFQMYIPFQDATSLPLQIRADDQYVFGGQSIARISATAARGKDGKLYLAITNTDPEHAETLDIGSSAALRSAQGQLLTHARMDAHNTFDDPDEVKPAPFEASARNGRIQLEIPAKSVLVLELE